MIYDGHNLVFIVGSPRSGTTWLQKILASHSQIKTGQESDVFDAYIGPQLRAWKRDLSPEYSARGGVGLGCYFSEEDFLKNLKNYLNVLLMPMLDGLSKNEIFLEKTPGHALYIPEIMELLPQARIIHILRDGRDVTASLLAVSRTWGKNWAPQKAGVAAYMWQQHVQAVKQYAPLISNGQFYELRYEQLYADTSGTLRNIIDFLVLQWDDACLLDAVQRNAPGARMQGNATPIPLQGEISLRSGLVVKDPPEFIRKATPGAWRKDLSLWEKFQVWRIAGKTLAQVGYKW